MSFHRNINIYICSIFILFLGGWTTSAIACPFCSAASQTLSEEIAAADVVVIAELVTPSSIASTTTGESQDNTTATDSPANTDSAVATFRILETLRGGDKLNDAVQLQVVYFGDGDKDKRFMVTGIADQRVDWSTPLPLSNQAVEYVKQLDSLPETGPDRLTFFLKYFENEDPLLAQDAYDEFARAPYAEIGELADRIDRKLLVKWIDDPQVGPTRRRLYLTMLGVCGQAEDIEMLESLLQYDYQQIKPGVATLVSVAGLTGSAFGLPIVDELIRAEERRKKQCLDALVACYLKLKGPEGLRLVEERFLNNPAAEYTHVYATIMALRFHGEETDVIPRERLLESLRLVLNNSEIADQVIPDLSRWEDWEVMDQLVDMFRSSKADDWIRQPVISYLIVASEQQGDVGTRAVQAIEELEQLDPKTVERARSLMAFSGFGRAKSNTEEEPQNTELQATEPATAQPATDLSATDTSQLVQTAKDTTADQEVVESKPSEATEASATASAAKVGEPSATEDVKLEMAAKAPTPERLSIKTPSAETPSRMTIIGVPIIAGLIMMAIFAVLLRGSDFRSPN